MMPRPTSVTVFGVLNNVFGALGLLSTAASAAVLFLPGFGSAQQENPLAVPPLMDAWLKISIALSVVACALLVASGIGLLRMRPWGRTTTLGYAVFALVVGGANMVVMLWTLRTLGQIDDRSSREVTFAQLQATSGLGGSCIGMIYPALLWLFMTRRHVVAAFGGMPSADPVAEWAPSVPGSSAAKDPNNPYVAPQTDAWSRTSVPASESIIETFVPSKNGPALASYYLGLFSLFPCLGFPLGVAAVYFGVKGLRRVREDPAVRGGAHAWVGVICGSLFGLFNFALVVLLIIGGIAAAVGSR